MPRQLITESHVRELLKKGSRQISVLRDAIVTSLAADFAAEHKMTIVRADAGAPPGKADASPAQTGQRSAGPGGGIVAFGADHGGFQLKEILMKHAAKLGYAVLDLGTSSEEPCDYPDYAYAVARAVSAGKAWRGVMVDGAGIGSCVVANKVPGVRAACCSNELVARNAREHNDTNVLTLGSRVSGVDVCKEVMSIWLETPFAGGRHQGRVDKITDLERRYLK